MLAVVQRKKVQSIGGDCSLNPILGTIGQFDGLGRLVESSVDGDNTTGTTSNNTGIIRFDAICLDLTQ